MRTTEPEYLPMIVIERLTKTFPERSGLKRFVRKPSRRMVLDNITLTVQRGELLGLLGANGAGKTTLLQVLATLAYGDRGTVTVGGVDAITEPARVRRMIGFCGSAERGFYYRLSARENLRFFGSLAGLRGSTRSRRIEEVLELVDLLDAADRNYAHFSSGMRQRLSVARALLADPPVLLFDEPTRAVDPVHAEAVRTLIRTTLVDQLGKTVVLATNLLEEAWDLCDRIAVLRAGRIAAIDTPANLQLMQSSNSRYHITVDRITDDLLHRTRSVSNVLQLSTFERDGRPTIEVEIAPADAPLTALLRAISSNGTDVHAITLQTAKPAEVFSALMQGER